MTIVAVIRPRASCLPLAGSGEAGRPLFRQVPSAWPCPPAQRQAALPGAFRKFLQAGSRQSARPAIGDHRTPRKRPWKPFGSICSSRAWPANRFPSIDELTAVRDCAERGISRTPPLPGSGKVRKRGLSRNGHRHWLPPARRRAGARPSAHLDGQQPPQLDQELPAAPPPNVLTTIGAGSISPRSASAHRQAKPAIRELSHLFQVTNPRTNLSMESSELSIDPHLH